MNAAAIRVTLACAPTKLTITFATAPLRALKDNSVKKVSLLKLCFARSIEVTIPHVSIRIY